MTLTCSDNKKIYSAIESLTVNLQIANSYQFSQYGASFSTIVKHTWYKYSLLVIFDSRHHYILRALLKGDQFLISCRRQCMSWTRKQWPLIVQLIWEYVSGMMSGRSRKPLADLNKTNSLREEHCLLASDETLAPGTQLKYQHLSPLVIHYIVQFRIANTSEFYEWMHYSEDTAFIFADPVKQELENCGERKRCHSATCAPW